MFTSESMREKGSNEQTKLKSYKVCVKDKRENDS